jgi:hypothetical protein
VRMCPSYLMRCDSASFSHGNINQFPVLRIKVMVLQLILKLQDSTYIQVVCVRKLRVLIFVW